MKKSIFFIPLLILTLLCSCTSQDGIYKPNVSGSAFEVLLVIEDSIYKTPGGEAMFNVLNEPTPHLPQPEPMFKMSKLPHSMFDNLLQTTRNIVFVEVDEHKYTKGKIRLDHDRWAKTQAIATVIAPNTEELKTLLENHGHAITNYFIKAERERMMAYYKANINEEALNRVYKKFDCKIAIPSSINKYNEKENFLWISNGSATVRQDFIIYSTPYYSKEQLTDSAILNRRDSVLKQNIPGSIEGSHMTTEYRYYPPKTQIVTMHDSWCAETRGLWKMANGESMGGPFISLTRIDELNMKIITVEGFIFAPGKLKRNPMRQMDAMVYSLLLPHEINEVIVTPENTQKK